MGELPNGKTTWGLLLALSSAWPALAQDTRMIRLTESSLMANIERDGVWSVEVSGDSILYHCRVCDGVVEARIEILNLDRSTSYASFAVEYQSERRSLCANLAAERVGRCMGMRAVNVKFGALRGFRSDSAFVDVRETEIALYYHESGIGPELIRLEISADTGAKLPQGTEVLLMEHLRKLTVAW